MWLIALLFAFFLGVYLQEKEAPLSSWVISALVTLLISFVSALIIPALIPDLRALMLPASAQIPAYIILTVTGLILGLLATACRRAIIK
jgi:RsiW-degrading membrane proteinase PrsW (M82 family)